MSVTVRIPTPLRPVTGGQGELKAEGKTVGDVLRQLDAQYPGFAERVFDENGVKRFINVYVNDDSIRDKKNLETEIKNGDTISILPAIAGGAAKL
jgi:molybdopterin synthase sulfur carrier subunit